MLLVSDRTTLGQVRKLSYECSRCAAFDWNSCVTFSAPGTFGIPATVCVLAQLGSVAYSLDQLGELVSWHFLMILCCRLGLGL